MGDVPIAMSKEKSALQPANELNMLSFKFVTIAITTEITNSSKH